MDFYVISTCTELGISQLIAPNFFSAEHMTFIEVVMEDTSIESALEKNPEATDDYVKNGLKGLVSAIDFFKKLHTIIERGTYKSASIRMDVQVSTRVMDHAPDCTLNMHLTTTDWEKSLNMSSETCDKLLVELQKAKTFIRQSRADALKKEKEKEEAK
ncbi:hypothetical protein CRE_19101 [Caenorhabditis remanei]|uniref:Uncharacterized protein n=1 Tax=Caenorhabditis remanei TaxID=31234 RepID=E3MJB8_CAERE|nr:hypothetical protein CRE_19101 [Caenorhabditis remanei]